MNDFSSVDGNSPSRAPQAVHANSRNKSFYDWFSKSRNGDERVMKGLRKSVHLSLGSRNYRGPEIGTPPMALDLFREVCNSMLCCGARFRCGVTSARLQAWSGSPVR